MSVRVRPPSLPLHRACTPTPPTVKTVPLAPVLKPCTGLSKLSVSAIVSPMLLPAPPDSVLVAMTGAVEPSVGAVVSSTKATGALEAPGLPAASVICAVRLLAPSAPRSAAATVNSTNLLAMSAAPSVMNFGTANAAPPSSRSTRSPCAASEPVLGSPTRKTVLCASAALMGPSARCVLPCSARVGADGAVVSSVNVSGLPGTLALPAWSVITAVRLLAPSRPRSAAVTVNSTALFERSAELSVTDFGVENGAPPSRRSTLSPAAASDPVVGRATRNTVLWASAELIRPSSRSVPPVCSATVAD